MTNHALGLVKEFKQVGRGNSEPSYWLSREETVRQQAAGSSSCQEMEGGRELLSELEEEKLGVCKQLVQGEVWGTVRTHPVKGYYSSCSLYHTYLYMPHSFCHHLALGWSWPCLCKESTFCSKVGLSTTGQAISKGVTGQQSCQETSPCCYSVCPKEVSDSRCPLSLHEEGCFRWWFVLLVSEETDIVSQMVGLEEAGHLSSFPLYSPYPVFPVIQVFPVTSKSCYLRRLR